MEFTVEQLLKAIRDADSLADLKKMVGPAKDVQEESAARLATLWPEHAKKLWDEQELYEQEHC